jgi:hypothetical protein
VKKNAPPKAEHDVGLVSLADMGLAMRATADHARSYAGDENVVEDWSGMPAVPTHIARDAVARFRADQEQRSRQEAEARIRREYNELLSQHPDLGDLNARDDWGGGERTPVLTGSRSSRRRSAAGGSTRSV